MSASHLHAGRRQVACPEAQLDVGKYGLLELGEGEGIVPTQCLMGTIPCCWLSACINVGEAWYCSYSGML